MDMFERRLSKQVTMLKKQYFKVYEMNDENIVYFENLLNIMEENYHKRERYLREKDVTRKNWHLDREVVGIMIYVDLFSSNFTEIVKKIPYLSELGITLVHLMPLLKPRSGENDGGYAVEDFKDVDPKLGTKMEFLEMLSAFREADIDVCIDYVLNHVSDTHVWAKKALSGEQEFQDLFEMYPDRKIPDLYEKTVPEVLPVKCPGNFTYKKEIDKWVFTSFSSFQWDLNFKNPKVFELIIDILLYLANAGIGMIRLDAIPFIWKELNTNCRNLPQVHELLQIIHTVKNIVCPSLVLLGEAIVEPDQIFRYFGEYENECDVLYNANLMVNIWNAYATRDSRLLYVDNIKYGAREGTCWMNYVRCHDDIGWGFNEDAIRSFSLDPYLHKQFLIDFYSQQFEGSFAKGEIYQYNPISKDARTNGTLASLLGLENALDFADPYAKEVALKRIAMAHALILSHNGIPLIYSGDEIGTINDYSYLNDVDKKEEGRWVHRPSFNWENARKRNDVSTIEGYVFTITKTLIDIRKKNKVFNSDSYIHYLQTNNDSVYSFYKKNGSERVLFIYNFSENNQYFENSIFVKNDLQLDMVDLVTNKRVNLEKSYIHLHPYEMLWLVEKKR